MTRSLLKGWRKPKPDDVPVRLPFSHIMEFAMALLSISPHELRALGLTFAHRKRLLDHMLACGRAAEGIESNKLTTKQIELRLPKGTLPACSISRCANCPRRRATRRLSTGCSPPSTRHGIDTSVHRTLHALASSPRPPEVRLYLCRFAINLLIGGHAGAREIAAAQSMRAGGPAAKHGPQGIGDSKTDLA